MSRASGPFPANPSPFLRWAGSKKQLLPSLALYWRHGHGRYIEPFAGSAALFFHLAPAEALIADINADLITTYTEVSGHPRAVANRLAKLPKGPNAYRRLRALDPGVMSPTDRSARFIYLNRYCFNGLYRTNSAGRFNVPYGGGKTGKLPSSRHLIECSRLLGSASIMCASFEVTLEEARADDFVYLDPPFRVDRQRVFTEYTASQFGPSHVHSLREWLVRLDRANVRFLLSYAASDEAEYLRKGFHFALVSVRRNIAGFAASRRFTAEMLISNAPPREPPSLDGHPVIQASPEV